MNSTFLRSGIAAAAIVSVAACGGTAQLPTSPSAATGGTLAAAADGSTLKVSAPSLVSPIGGARVDTRRPTFTWTDSAGTFTASVNPTYDLEVSGADGTVLLSTNVAGTSYQSTVDAAFDTTYNWRVRARQDGAAGPWSAVANFVTPKQQATGGLVLEGFRAPDPPPGSRLPLPNESGTVNAQYGANYDDWQHSCQDEYGQRGWIWLDKLIDTLRTKDLRWGYNGKRGNPNDPSKDVIDYHSGAGDSQFSTRVYIIDVMGGHCGASPTPGWNDVTDITFNSGTVGMFIYPRPGRVPTP